MTERQRQTDVLLAVTHMRVAHPRRLILLLLVAGILGATCSGAWAGQAAASTFVRGDVFALGSAGVQEYSPTGQLQQTLPNTSGATALCFDASGQDLVLPGVGLFDNSANQLPSFWGTNTSVQRCVADSSGHVYASEGTTGTGTESIVKYNLQGSVLHTFPISAAERAPLAIALAPDRCTIYYGSFTGLAGGAISRLNVCTNTPEADFIPDSFVDDVSVLRDGRVIAVDDPQAQLWDSAGTTVLQTYTPPDKVTSLHSVSLDPDGTSVWLCCDLGQVMRFDIGSGMLLTSWPTSSALAIAVYAPPAPPRHHHHHHHPGHLPWHR
jgi:hypothetical protein